MAMTALVFTACSDDDNTSSKIEPAVLTASIESIEEADTLNGATFTFDVPGANSEATYFIAIGSDPTMKVTNLVKATKEDGKYKATVYLLDRSVFYSYRVVEMVNYQTTAQSAKLGEYRLGHSYDMSQIDAEDVEISDITLNSARITLYQPENATGVKFYAFISANEDMTERDTIELARNDEGNYYGDFTELKQGTTYYYQVASLKDHIYEVKSDDSFNFTTLNDPTFLVEVTLVESENINIFGYETLQTIMEKLRKEYASEADNYCFVSPEGFEAATQKFDAVTSAKYQEYYNYLLQIISDKKYCVDPEIVPSIKLTVSMKNVEDEEQSYNRVISTNQQ